jgi:hypothetical protein
MGLIRWTGYLGRGEQISHNTCEQWAIILSNVNGRTFWPQFSRKDADRICNFYLLEAFVIACPGWFPLLQHLAPVHNGSSPGSALSSPKITTWNQHHTVNNQQ